MRLNPDCVRDILLTVEEVTCFNRILWYKINENDFPLLLKYSHEELIYHIRQCKLSNLILGVKFYDSGDSASISDLSPYGHKFLADIRSDNIWKHTKSIATKVGSVSLDSLIQISTGVLTQIINKQLGC